MFLFTYRVNSSVKLVNASTDIWQPVREQHCLCQSKHNAHAHGSLFINVSSFLLSFFLSLSLALHFRLPLSSCTAYLKHLKHHVIFKSRVCVCVCERERGRDRERGKNKHGNVDYAK